MTDKERKLLDKIHREALKPEQATWADEDLVTLTRQEIRALWVILQREAYDRVSR